MSAAPPPFHSSGGESRPRGNTVVSYGYAHTQEGSGVVAPVRAVMMFDGTAPGLSLKCSFTSRVAVPDKPLEVAVIVTCPPASAVGVYTPLLSTAPMAGDVAVHT